MFTSTTLVFLALYTSTVASYVVTPNKCGPRPWIRRDCDPLVSPRTWNDICRSIRGNEVKVPGEGCPPNTYCQNTLEGTYTEFWRSIRCNTVPAPGTKDTRKRQGDPQAGSSSTKQARTSLENTQFELDVVISDDMQASVSAVLMSDDNSFILTPANIIVGKIHGKETTVCQGDHSSPERALECIPEARFDLKFGDQIDFTWGMRSEQKGSLKYNIFPSG